MDDATKNFFTTGECKFDSDVLHIHVDHIEQNHCLIAIATEFGQIKIFEVKNYSRGGAKHHHSNTSKHSEFREYLSGNISCNVCKI